jgi:type IV pilus assembly protein PilP
MKKGFKQMRLSLAVVFLEVFAWETTMAQDSTQLPSQKTKDAVEKFNNAPATIGKTFQDMTDAVKNKLRQELSVKTGPEEKAIAGELDAKGKKAAAPAGEHVAPQINRDPFRPMSLRTKTPPRARENLSPLERFELGQLKIVGVIWDLKEPRALIEDTAGLGYIVKVGTPIGGNDGTVKAIGRSEVIVEEFYEDSSGARRKRDVSMRLPTE